MSEQRDPFEAGRERYRDELAQKSSERAALRQRAKSEIDEIEVRLKDIFCPKGYKFDRSDSSDGSEILIDAEHDKSDFRKKRKDIRISSNGSEGYHIDCETNYPDLRVFESGANKERVIEVAGMFYEVTGGSSTWGDSDQVRQRLAATSKRNDELGKKENTRRNGRKLVPKLQQICLACSSLLRQVLP